METRSLQGTPYLDVALVVWETMGEKTSDPMVLEQFLSAFNLNNIHRFGGVKSHVEPRHLSALYPNFPVSRFVATYRPRSRGRERS